MQIQEYNTAVLKRESELKTTTQANPMIQELDTQIENLRQQIAENLKNTAVLYN
jgi:hypothetical protein